MDSSPLAFSGMNAAAPGGAPRGGSIRSIASG